MSGPETEGAAPVETVAAAPKNPMVRTRMKRMKAMYAHTNLRFSRTAPAHPMIEQMNESTPTTISPEAGDWNTRLGSVVVGGLDVQSHPTASVEVPGLHASSQYWSSVLLKLMPYEREIAPTAMKINDRRSMTKLTTIIRRFAVLYLQHVAMFGAARVSLVQPDYDLVLL
eukprot:CAMPEP_0180218188 /NCGR_PEP_ID=MMETSP0987-20121128/17497_1 /TAXON_ID=697907 /ORGANISM="non described non described, Strain CCMP2293" /LENGTH=169 /DNA_ID=CAMNT_0022178099 /DNA_START=521 /DNA_END=1027 /DNA_ORIENTATION=+